jgi:hypothetical protein
VSNTSYLSASDALAEALRRLRGNMARRGIDGDVTSVQTIRSTQLSDGWTRVAIVQLDGLTHKTIIPYMRLVMKPVLLSVEVSPSMDDVRTSPVTVRRLPG